MIPIVVGLFGFVLSVVGEDLRWWVYLLSACKR